MKDKINKILSIGWLANIIVLLVLILVPKNNNIYNRLYILFMLCIFAFPIILIALQVFYKIKDKTKISIWSCVPNLGCILLMLLTFVKFIQSIEKYVIFEMVVIMMIFICLELLLGYIIMKYKDMKNKTYIWCNLGIYVTLVLFFLCAMIISYDYSIIW